jgi:C1A family cysteine protease
MARTSAAPASAHRFGWVPDVPDRRDHLYAAPIAAIAKLPAKVDLRKGCPPVYDQGDLGSCTANAIGAAIQFDQKKQKKRAFTPSRLFIYYNEREMEGTVDSDAGAAIRDGIKSVARLGACPERMWPYLIARFRDRPTAQCYAAAMKHRAVLYQRVGRIKDQMKGCLASGFPFVFGFSVYDSFETATVARTGKAPMPAPGEKMLGGHAVLAVGYDERERRFIVRNSWGTRWGIKGYFTMPYEYLLDDSLSDDFWTIRLVE